VYNKVADNEYQIMLPTDARKGKAGYYSFATPWFQMCPSADIGRAAKSGSRIFMMFDGRLATDLGKKSNVDMYIVYGNLKDAAGEVKEYPARHVAANAYKGTGAPFMETLQPMKTVKKSDGTYTEERCAPLEADNKYYVVKKD